MQNTITTNDILEQFLTENQRIYSELETLGLTLEAIEVIIVPIERRISVRIKEFNKSSMITHQKGCELRMKEVQFDDRTPRGYVKWDDLRTFTPETLDEILKNKEVEQ